MSVSVNQPRDDDFASAVDFAGVRGQSFRVWTLSDSGDSVTFNPDISIANDLAPLVDCDDRGTVEQIALGKGQSVRHNDCKLHRIKDSPS